MIQYLIAFSIVAVALYFTGRKIFYQTKGQGCSGCNCKSKADEIGKLVNTKED